MKTELALLGLNQSRGMDMNCKRILSVNVVGDADDIVVVPEVEDVVER